MAMGSSDGPGLAVDPGHMNDGGGGGPIDDPGAGGGPIIGGGGIV